MANSPDDGIASTSIPPAELRKKPWKYIGYQGYSKFVASDDDFFILRRFSELTARVLLALQDELSELEAQLLTLETRLSQTTAPDIHNGSFRQETERARLELIRELDSKLRAYNQLVIQHSDLRSRPPVPKKDVERISNWLHNHQNAVWHEETEYIKKSNDLFAMVPRAKTPLRRLLERSSHFRFWGVWKNDAVPEMENVHYRSDDRIDLFVALMIALVGLIMLVVPLWLLAFVTETVNRLVIITTCLVIFLLFVSFSTATRPFESLGATAAYAAVLVVFLQAAA